MARKSPSGVDDNHVFEYLGNLAEAGSKQVGSILAAAHGGLGIQFGDFTDDDVQPGVHSIRVPFDGKIVNTEATFFWNEDTDAIFRVVFESVFKLIEFKTYADVVNSAFVEQNELLLARTMAQIVVPAGFEVPGPDNPGGLAASFRSLPIEIIEPNLKGGTYIMWRASPWGQTDNPSADMYLHIAFGLE